MNFCFADEDFELFSLGEDGMFALPASVTLEDDGSLRITSYRVCESVTREFCRCFRKDPFSTEAREFLLRNLTPVMKNYGLDKAEETGDVLLEFRTREMTHAPKKAVILSTNEALSHYSADTTLWRLQVDDEDILDVICAVIENDRILAFAAVNDLTGPDAEINVECSPSSRRKGYATDCVRGLTKYLLQNGATRVSYVCREQNTASVRTALKAGFSLSGKSMNFIFYR